MGGCRDKFGWMVGTSFRFCLEENIDVSIQRNGLIFFWHNNWHNMVKKDIFHFSSCQLLAFIRLSALFFLPHSNSCCSRPCSNTAHSHHLTLAAHLLTCATFPHQPSSTSLIVCQIVSFACFICLLFFDFRERELWWWMNIKSHVENRKKKALEAWNLIKSFCTIETFEGFG